jgi:hypothetical protein
VALDREEDDVDRLFRHLVHTLADRRPAQLHSPFQVSELYQDILPYRLFRSQLRFDTNEDYEMAVLRLLAGAKGYAALEPPEAQQVLTLEAEAVNPFPGAFRDYAAARVTLSPAAVRTVLAARSSYAPAQAPLEEARPAASPPAAPVEEGPPAESSEVRPLPYTLDAVPHESAACPHCARALPSHRAVVYCPYCGKHVEARRCAACDTELEAGWVYCITCGTERMPR